MNYQDININLDEINNVNEAGDAVAKLREAIRHHDYRYYVLNDPVVSDAEYDRLFSQLQELEEKYPDLRIPTHLHSVLPDSLWMSLKLLNIRRLCKVSFQLKKKRI